MQERERRRAVGTKRLRLLWGTLSFPDYLSPLPLLLEFFVHRNAQFLKIQPL